MIIDRWAGSPRSRLLGMSAMNLTTARSWRAEMTVMGGNLHMRIRYEMRCFGTL
jgi:hypothetical protein